jgi:hypothetical protein
LKLEQKKFEENRDLKLESKLESRTKNRVVVTWSSRLVEKWRPNIAVVNRSISLFNNNVMQHFRKILKSTQKQMILYMFFSKEKSSGGNVNEPQPSTSGFQVKEGQFTSQ